MYMIEGERDTQRKIAQKPGQDQTINVSGDERRKKKDSMVYGQ